MKNWMKALPILLIVSLLLTGCSMWGKKPEVITPSPTPSLLPDNLEKLMNNSTVTDYLAHLQQQNMILKDISKIEIKDFNALEGSAFTYRDDMFYLYRFDMQDEKIRALLDNASTTGIMRVMMDGKEIDMHAMVNKNYALIYDKDTNIDGIKGIFDGFDFKKIDEPMSE